MKNKARCKHFGKISSCCALVFLLISIFMFPVSAMEMTWGDFSETTSRVELGYMQNASEDLYKSYVSEISAQKILNIVQQQYSIGLYGGNIPIAIGIVTNQRTDGNENFYSSQGYVVYTINQSKLIGGTNKGTANVGFTLRYGDVYERNAYSVNSYRIYENGDVEPISAGINSVYIMNDTSVEGLKWLAVRSGRSWIIESSNPLFITSYFPNEKITNTALDDLSTKYTQYLNQGVPVYNYTLDVPGIITAIPNGAKQIINNAFGFEIFGINVAGLLSVILVVAIVGFVVKWLMSR